MNGGPSSDASSDPASQSVTSLSFQAQYVRTNSYQEGKVYPLVVPLGVAMPEVKVRKMRSQWGNCHWLKGYITLNTALARCPEELREYVALHELVHFLHHDHGPGFYAQMDQLMPDWRQRRRVLKGCGGALEEQRKL